jgi:hypothetical protein
MGADRCCHQAWDAMSAPLTATIRPKCPRPGHGKRLIWMDGASHNSSAVHRRIRWRCVGTNRADFHRFSLPEPVRHPVGHSDACTQCDHVYTAAEGPRTGRHATFTYREVADALIDVGRGSTYRDAASRARRAAKRADGPDTTKPNLVMDWLDTFGAIVLAHYEKKAATSCPIAIAIDSKPLRRRSFNVDTGRRKKAENGEIYCVMDMAVRKRDGVPLMLKLAGGKDHVSVLRLLRDAGLSGAPAWVVADADLGIEKAVRIAFPDAVLYRCEGHMLMNAREAYVADSLPQWVRKSADEIAGPAAYGAPKGRDRLWKQPDLLVALEQSLWSTDNWHKFEALVASDVPKGKWHLRLWMEEVAGLVEIQGEYRKRYPGMPRATGSLEAAVLDKVTHWVGPRAGYFRNRRRLDIALGLMRLELSKVADPGDYAAIIRAHYKTNGYRSAARWRAHRDVLGTSSIDDLILTSDIAAAAEREREQAAANLDRRREHSEEARIARMEAGLDPVTGRPRRPDGARAGAYRSVAGKVVADFPDLLATWDVAANRAIGLDAATTKASVLNRAFWACPVHVSHRWDATVKDKSTYPVGCPYCMDRRACPTNSVAALFPDVAKEWHPTRNGSLTAHDFVKGANKRAWWKCAKSGHVWETRIDARTLGDQGCPKCARGAQKERERDVNALRHRRNRALAKVSRTTPTLPEMEAASADLEALFGPDPAPLIDLDDDLPF